MEKKYLLAFETTADHLGIALVDARGREIFSYSEMAFRHLSDLLHPKIDEAMKKSGISYAELMAVACVRGPGSFTSVRVGISAAKGLAFALDIPVVSLTSLEALALPHTTNENTVHAWIEAQSGHIYSSTFVKGVQSEPVHMKVEDAVKHIKEGELLVGSGALKYASDVPSFVTIPEESTYINPVNFASLALERFYKKTDDAGNTTALYVQPLTYDKTYNADGTKL